MKANYQQEQWYKDLPQYKPLFSYRDKKNMVMIRKGGKYAQTVFIRKAMCEFCKKKRHLLKVLVRLN